MPKEGKQPVIARRSARQEEHTLVVASHVIHYEHGGALHAYGPYSREIDVWAGLFRRVVIAAPCRKAPPPKDCLAFAAPNIRIAPMVETGGRTLGAKVVQVGLLPLLISGLCRLMLRADVIHVRCPGNLGLLGALLAPLFGKPMIAKYAGQWNGYPGEALTNRFQRWLLRSRWWSEGIVTVYGEWPGQPPQVVPFFTAMMTQRQVDEAVASAEEKTLSAPLQILFAGRLAESKRVDTLLAAARLLADRGAAFHVTVLGDGPERERLESIRNAASLNSHVTFAGPVPYDEMMGWYKRSHLLVLPSRNEGWPKVLAEAMCHGLVCIATGRGLMPWLLEGRGIVVRPDDPRQIADAIERIAGDPREYRRLSRAASLWARQHSLEGLGEALRGLMREKWAPAEPPDSKPAAVSPTV